MNRQNSIKKFNKIDIYPVISSEFCAGSTPLDVLKAIADGGAKIVQLREKNIPKNQILQLGCEFRKITAKYGMILIMNDHVDIALDIDADGIHLGQDDTTLQEARGLAPELMIGISTHSKAEALEAQAAGADNINIGPIYNTQTKSLPFDALGTDILNIIPPLLHIPFSVMGGIKEAHLAELIALGATRIAMVTEITQAKNITKRVCELRKYWEER